MFVDKVKNVAQQNKGKVGELEEEMDAIGR